MTAKNKTLEALEAQVAYNEKMINDLSEVVASQGRQIEQLKAEIEALSGGAPQIREDETASH